MKHKLKLWVHKTRKHHKLVPIAILVALALVLGSVSLYLSSDSSIESKITQAKDSFAEYNSLFGNLTIDTDTEKAISELSLYQTSARSISDFPNNYQHIKANAQERIFHKGSADELKRINDTIATFFSDNTDNVASIAYALDTLAKFLNYSPVEDMALLGTDSIQDSERIERTKIAFKELSSDTKLSAVSRSAINSSANALNKVAGPDDTAAYADVIIESKSIILNDLSAKIENAKSVTSEFYNLLLYQ